MKKFILLSIVVISIPLYGTAHAVPVPLEPGHVFLKDGAPVGPYGFTLGSGFYSGFTGPGAGYTPGSYTQTSGPNNTTMTTNSIGEKSEFRVIDSNGSISGGGEKSLFGVRDDGAVGDNGLNQVTWTIGGGMVIATDGDLTPGATNSPVGQVPGLTTDAIFFSNELGFAGGSLDPIFATVDYSTNKLMFKAASIEFQWSDYFFPLGLADPNNECNTDGQGCGIQFEGDIVQLGGGKFDFTIFGEHRITLWESTEGGTAAVPTGLEGLTMQWAWKGTYIPVSAVPVPAAFWLFGSGLLALVGFGRRRLS